MFSTSKIMPLTVLYYTTNNNDNNKSAHLSSANIDLSLVEQEKMGGIWGFCNALCYFTLSLKPRPPKPETKPEIQC